uniref:Uncharacterized protein n=1 Tax=Plectus sambesii TaxID=2011161 RepID=A0A914VW29_9BILA
MAAFCGQDAAGELVHTPGTARSVCCPNTVTDGPLSETQRVKWWQEAVGPLLAARECANRALRSKAQIAVLFVESGRDDDDVGGETVGQCASC